MVALIVSTCVDRSHSAERRGHTVKRGLMFAS